MNVDSGLVSLYMRSALFRRIMTTVQAVEAKWFDHLPAPRSKPAQVSPEDLHTLLRKEGHKVLVIDVRRTDIEVSR